MDKPELKSLLEALLFVSGEPLTLDHFRSVIPDEPKDVIREALDELQADYEAKGSGMALREVAGGYQLFSHPRWHSQIQSLLSKPLMVRLSRSALEALAIIAYKQPITLPEVSEIRSCNSAGAVKTLLEYNLIKVMGRKRVVGRPFVYGTTREFFVHFGLKDLADLPQLSEFEELIGEKLSPEVFQSGQSDLEMEEDAQSEGNSEEKAEEPDFDTELQELPLEET